jgi:hypothetical protein
MALSEKAHLVGSLNLPDARTVFETACAEAGDVLARIPDGETDDRRGWITAQIPNLASVPELELVSRPRGPHDDWLPDEGLIWFRLKDGASADAVELPELGYVAAAASSFATFSELKRGGTIAAPVRFQVSLPTPLAVVGAYIAPQDAAAIEPRVEAAMRREVDGLAATVPHDELAIQWDVAVEITNVEGVFPTFFSPVLDGVAERLRRLATWVPDDVPVGFHLCYGDAGGKHVIEPNDAAVLVEVANAIVRSAPRVPAWIHMPVPIERDDDAYFAPLEGLALPRETALYLGLLHKEDGLEGAKRRIAAARRHVERFGVATECGMARDAEPGDVPGLLRLHAAAAELVS